MGHIPERLIEKIKDKADIVDIVSKTVSLKKSGRNYVGLCPFHSEKTPSFFVSFEKQMYYCFGCGAGGDAYKFLMRRDGISFPEAVKNLGNIYNIQITESSPRKKRMPVLEIKKGSLEYNIHSEFRADILRALDTTHNIYLEELGTNTSSGADRARRYLEGRKISRNLIEKVEIGYAPPNDIFRFRLMKEIGFSKNKLTEILFRAGLINQDGFRAFSNRITLPIRTLDGELIGFNSRITNGAKQNKYKNTANRELFSKGRILYGLNLINKDEVQHRGLFLVEGQFDTFGFVKQGVNSCLGIGSSHLSSYNLDTIGEINPEAIFLVTDGDSAGISAAVKNANSLCSNGLFRKNDISIVPMPDGKDPFDLFYFDEIDIIDYYHRKALDVRDFISFHGLDAFDSKTKSGLDNLKDISSNLFEKEEFREVADKLL